jgi:hypothetical protein
LTQAATLGGRVPWTEVDVDLHEGPRQIDVSYNLLDAATGGAIKRQNEEDRRAVDSARDKLRAVQNASSQVNGANPEEVERYNEQLEIAREEYRDAIEEKDLSEIGQLNNRITEFTNTLKSALFSLIRMLREAVQKVEAFFKEIFDELKKIMGEFFGGGGSLADILAAKAAIIQMITIIQQIIKLFAGDLHCDDDEKDIKVERFISPQADMAIWTDDQGVLHIEEDPEIIRSAVNKVVQALGITPFNLNKSTSEETTPRQKLQSLIKFTGDPVLDSSIARTTERITTPISVVFKCPLQTTVKDAEQINKWVNELNIA